MKTLTAPEMQNARTERALAEYESYQYESRSAFYEEPACRVTTANGSYLCFDDQCTCPDWTHRGPVIGDGSIQECKHMIAAYVTFNLVDPPVTPPDVTTAPAWFPSEETAPVLAAA